MRMGRFLGLVKLATVLPGGGRAHVSEQGFVLLLPTDIYIGSGVAVVALTVVIMALLPRARHAPALIRFTPVQGAVQGAVQGHWLGTGLSLLCLGLLAGMVWVGLSGPRDPLSNLMPLGFWTLGWIALISLAGVVGNIWAWANPWSGLYRLLGAPKPVARLPRALGCWPAVALLVGYTGFLLADVAPDDPARLARLVAGYWAVMFAVVMLFGPAALARVELGHVIFDAYSRLAPLSLRGGGLGVPGWQVLERAALPGLGAFAITLLATGSFDGLNETFWWLGVIGVNPLEFPGRSAVIGPTLAGLAVSVLGLMASFALTVWIGLRLARASDRFAQAAPRLALSLLPIAFVYHVAHYLPSFLVSIQYTLAALSDPWAQGADFLGIQPFYVTTGFFNVLSTVRVIWLTQAGLVVLGHVWSVILCHRIALDLVPERARAVLATAPLSLFMIAYTLLGLWLLAAPRGA